MLALSCVSSSRNRGRGAGSRTGVPEQPKVPDPLPPVRDLVPTAARALGAPRLPIPSAPCAAATANPRPCSREGPRAPCIQGHTEGKEAPGAMKRIQYRDKPFLPQLAAAATDRHGMMVNQGFC